MYVLVEDGKVVKTVGSIPRSYKNVSGFNKLSDEKLKAYGFMPLVKDETKTPKNKKLEKATFKVEKDRVVEQKTFKNFTAAELSKKAEEDKKVCLNLCRQALRQSDFLMLEDAPIDAATKTAITEMRSKLYAMQQDNSLLKDDTKTKVETFLGNLRDNVYEAVSL